MKFTIVKDPIPYLYIENVFTVEEQLNIYKELEFIQPNLMGPDHTGTARDEKTQEALKNNSGVFLDSLYNFRHFSSILTYNRKFFTKKVFDELFKCNLAYELILNCNLDNTLISYYENSGHYKTHKDSAIITINSWFFKEPKNFTGGEFIFSDYNINIPVKNNCSVIFFSSYRHEVTPIKIIDQTVPCSGRFSMSMFVNQGPRNDN
jgi:Rps23 Pro-64 3,4-dihydroxylase Tpa1-like proline 4-hydroxylase